MIYQEIQKKIKYIIRKVLLNDISDYNRYKRWFFGTDVSGQIVLPVIMVKNIQTNTFLGSVFDGERIGSLNFYHNYLHHRHFGD